MSVRRRKWRDPSTGALKEVWMVDIVFEHADGRKGAGAKGRARADPARRRSLRAAASGVLARPISATKGGPDAQYL